MEMKDLVPDKYGYVSITLHRDELLIPPGMSLSSWIADKTCYFRVRYVLMSLEEKGLGYVFSPYSNTVAIGRGIVPPKQPVQKR